MKRYKPSKGGSYYFIKRPLEYKRPVGHFSAKLINDHYPISMTIGTKIVKINKRPRSFIRETRVMGVWWPLMGLALYACRGVLDLSGSLSVRCLWSEGGSRLVGWVPLVVVSPPIAPRASKG